jgi:hypothetical protein
VNLSPADVGSHLAQNRVLLIGFAEAVDEVRIETDPITKFYSQLYPLRKNPTQMAADGTNNFYDGGQPDNDWFPDFINRLRSDGIRDWDAKLLRRFQIHESIAFTVSCDFLNLTNHTQFGSPNITATATNFGYVTNQLNGPRDLQLNLKIEF